MVRLGVTEGRLAVLDVVIERLGDKADVAETQRHEAQPVIVIVGELGGRERQRVGEQVGAQQRRRAGDRVGHE